jgi:transcriptional regulator with XRE-family HTH domain
MQDATSQDTTEGHSEYQVWPSDFSDATFARRLRLVREAAGMTQQQLADAMAATGNKIHRSTIGKIESGGRPVTIGEAVQLAGILGIPLELLVTEPSPDTWERRAHLVRVEAQVRLRGLKHEAAERHRLLEEARVLYEDTERRIKRAERDLAALGGELPTTITGGKDDQ